MNNKKIYRVIFTQNKEVYEVYATHMFQSDLFGFIEIEEFSFDGRSKLLVTPSQEKLRSEFENVMRSYIPINSIMRIDEVEKEGSSNISKLKSVNNVANLAKKT